MSGNNDALILQLLQEVRDKQTSIDDRFASFDLLAQGFDAALKKHAEDSVTRHAELLGAFPAGDTDGHRRYHEAMIERIELRNKVVRECLTYAMKAGFLAGLGWVLYAIWLSLKLELMKNGG